MVYFLRPLKTELFNRDTIQYPYIRIWAVEEDEPL